MVTLAIGRSINQRNKHSEAPGPRDNSSLLREVWQAISYLHHYIFHVESWRKRENDPPSDPENVSIETGTRTLEDWDWEYGTKVYTLAQL